MARDDALNYTEPWEWMHPPRHALGALLDKQGPVYGAADVFRTDLGCIPGLARCCHHPDDVWALKGLIQCLQQSGNAAQADLLRPKLARAQARADINITTACCCATSHAQL